MCIHISASDASFRKKQQGTVRHNTHTRMISNREYPVNMYQDPNDDDIVIRTRELTKVFRRIRENKSSSLDKGGEYQMSSGITSKTRTPRKLVVVDKLNLEVRKGDIFGFLGYNGSGKTTTIRMLLGLIHPTCGSATLFGKDNVSQLPEILPRIGAMVEPPVFYPDLSVIDNLRIIAANSGMALGKANNSRLDWTINTVGLSDYREVAYKKLSSGNKRLLGIATALLADPELVILDEPTDNLDPAAVQRILDLIKELHKSGKTIFLSSHNLAEVQQICNRVAILKEGKLVKEGNVNDLLRERIVIHMSNSSDAQKVQETLDEAKKQGRLNIIGSAIVNKKTPEEIFIDAPLTHLTGLNKFMSEKKLYATEIYHDKRSLEEIFLEFTSESHCQKCQASLPSNANFCSNCRNPVTPKGEQQKNNSANSLHLQDTQPLPVLQFDPKVDTDKKRFFHTLRQSTLGELYKTRRHLMSKVLLLVGVSIFVIAFSFIALTVSLASSTQHCAHGNLNCIQTPSAGLTTGELKLPDSLPVTVNIFGYVGPVLIIILVGMTVGEEYGEWTIRVILTRGPTRTQYLLAKVLASFVYVILTIAILLPLGIIAGGLLYKLLTGANINFTFFTRDWVLHAIIYLFVVTLNLFTYAMLALTLATLGRSAPAGVAGSIVWWFLEGILSEILLTVGSANSGTMGDILKAIPDYFIGNNISALLLEQHSHLVSVGKGISNTVNTIPDWRAWLVITTYLVVFLGIAWFAQKRDITY